MCHLRSMANLPQFGSALLVIEDVKESLETHVESESREFLRKNASLSSCHPGVC